MVKYASEDINVSFKKLYRFVVFKKTTMWKRICLSMCNDNVYFPPCYTMYRFFHDLRPTRPAMTRNVCNKNTSQNTAIEP